MKRALFAAAASALGALGTAGLMAAAPAQAACNDDTPPLTPARVECVTNANIAQFVDSANPVNQVNTFLNGTDTTEGGVTTNDGLGILDQPATFVDSVVGKGGFLDGPREP
jgi:hypothetical protein